MHEKDLRRLALESGKTQSRKARHKVASGQGSAAGSSRSSVAGSNPVSPHLSPTRSPGRSPGISPGGSRNGSRAASRAGSEDEDGLDSDAGSDNSSLDLSGLTQFDDAPPEIWRHELGHVSDQIIERARNMRNTGAAREEIMGLYINILRAQYAAEEISSKSHELMQAFLKIIKNGNTEREILLALKALSITVLTTGDEVFDQLSGVLKSRASDPSSQEAQAGAIHALGAIAFFGGADLGETEQTMEFFLDIATSDGESVDAADSGTVVAAALEEWGLLATQFGAMNGTTDEAMAAFEDQLDSSILSVQTAAGQNIALLFEKSYEPLDEDEEEDDIAPEYIDDKESGSFRREVWSHRYDAYPSGDFALDAKLQGLATASARYLGKENRRNMHKEFRDLHHSVAHPWRGPRYSTNIEKDHDRYLGHRLAVRDGRQLSYTIDRWWKYLRYEAIKRIVGGGVITHYRLNPAIREVLSQTLMAEEKF